jgi:hypothetical protein
MDALSYFYIGSTLILFVSKAVGNWEPFFSIGTKFKRFFPFLSQIPLLMHVYGFVPVQILSIIVYSSCVNPSSCVSACRLWFGKGGQMIPTLLWACTLLWVKPSIIRPTPHAWEAQPWLKKAAAFCLSQTHIYVNDPHYLRSMMFHLYEERIWVKWVLPRQVDVEVATSCLFFVSTSTHLIFFAPSHPSCSVQCQVKLSIIRLTPHTREAQLRLKKAATFSPKPMSMLMKLTI